MYLLSQDFIYQHFLPRQTNADPKTEPFFTLPREGFLPIHKMIKKNFKISARIGLDLIHLAH
jgi:hypothetical protein